MHSEETETRFVWFAGLLQKQAVLFQHRDPVQAEMLAAYWRLLRRYTDGEIETAFQACWGARKARGLPMPGEVQAHLKVTSGSAAASAERKELARELTPEEQLRQGAWATFAGWLLRTKRWTEIDDPAKRAAVVSEFEKWCETDKDGVRAHLIGLIDPEAVKP